MAVSESRMRFGVAHVRRPTAPTKTLRRGPLAVHSQRTGGVYPATEGNRGLRKSGDVGTIRNVSQADSAGSIPVTRSSFARHIYSGSARRGL
jgi:hypothetical protein